MGWLSKVVRGVKRFVQAAVSPTFDAVSVPAISSIMAHELGHNMGLSLLWHSDEPANLMYSKKERGLMLTQGQLTIARSARCVSFW